MMYPLVHRASFVHAVGSLATTNRFLHTSLHLLKKQRKFTSMKGKSHSSHQWLNRHVNDPFVKQAQVDNYRARSAYKLLEIDAKYRLLHPGHTVIDCGAAPGSWTQVAVERTRANDPEGGNVVAVDLLHMQPIEGAVILSQQDFTDPGTQQEILAHLDGQLANTVLSDMAPNATGIHSMDHEQIVELVRTAAEFAYKVLGENGNFLAKLWDGHHMGLLKSDLAQGFRTMKILRPEASRKDSSEIYLLAKGFKRYLVHPVT